jgi:hypothetical protein
VLRYLRSLFSGHPEHYTGHNPAGALAIVALLGMTVLLAASGWANYNDAGGSWTEEVHEVVANAMLALVGIHVLAVLASSWLHRENLVAAMLHGRKRGAAADGIAKPWRPLAALLLAAVLGFWWWQWQAAPARVGGDHPAAAAQQSQKDDD